MAEKMEESDGVVDLGDIILGAPSPENCTLDNIILGTQRVAKYFDDGMLYFGTVTKHFAPNQTKAGIHLWNILFDDGDIEDFNRFELREAIELYNQEEALDTEKPPTRRVTLSPVYKDDLEGNESENSEEEEVIRPSATRTRKRQWGNDENEARRVTLSPESEDDIMEGNESENSEVEAIQPSATRKRRCESSDDEDKELGASLPARKPYAALDESSDEEEETTPKHLSKIKASITPVFKDDMEGYESENSVVEVIRPSATRKRHCSENEEEARRVTLSPVFKDDMEESGNESENTEEMIRSSTTRRCESSDDEELGRTVASLPARKPYASIDESSDDEEEEKPPKRRLAKIKSPKARSTTVFKDDMEGYESERSVEEVIRPSATRTRKRQWCESSDDEDEHELGTAVASLPARKPHASIDESSDDEDEETTPKRHSIIKSMKGRTKHARLKRQASIDESSDEEEEFDDEETTPQRLARIKSIKARKKYARIEQEAWLGGGDDEFSDDDEDLSDDDDELDAEEGFHRSELEYHMGGSKKRRGMEYGVPPEAPIELTVAQKSEMLDKIEKPADKALQKLLLNEGFQFQLLPHQFLAVRKVTGVPDKFPLHVGSQVTEPDEATMSDALIGLELDVNKCRTKGVLLADDMGCGKTVEAIASAVLRNALAEARNEPARPTVIVSPNDAVQVQWRDTLVKNGVLLEIIHMFEVGQPSRDFDKPIFVLLTRYTLQREVKRVFNMLEEATYNAEAEHLATSVLFPHVTIGNLEALKVQYMDENSKEYVINTYRDPKVESMADCVTRLIHLCTRRMQRNSTAEPIFQMLIIDESHFLKRLTTFWGMGAALMATHALRTTPLTGTPYNNGASDMATQMTFIDAAKHAAYKDWWSDATGLVQAETIRKRVAKWHLEYLVRRRKEDVLEDLVKKTVESRLLSQFAAEQVVYENYESILDPVLKEFAQLLVYQENPAVRKQLKEMFTVMMAVMSLMRMANIHAMLPGGREYTKQFSPTRNHLLSMEERPKSCVCCDQIMRPSIKVPEPAGDDKENGNKRRKNRRRFRGGTADVDEMEEFKEVDDDAVEMHEEEEEEELVPLPCSLCEARNGPVNHFAHEQCLETLKAANAPCPRCVHSKNSTRYEVPGEETRVYCPHIKGGFVGSSKINKVVDWFTDEVPKEDKVLILSFFKGGLDLIEGIFTHDLGIDCARFDGDLHRHVSIAELERFKKEPGCRVLLASVQSGGVGLNICEANHVAFLDRWFNPFVHQQAEDRCHRIGQTKDVKVVYFDSAATVDEAMIRMNEVKKKNSAILLADGFEIGNQQSLSYQEVSGVLGNLLAVIRSHRTGWLESSPENKLLPIPPVPQGVMADALEGKLALNQSAAASKGEGDESKENAHAGTNGTEDVIVADDDDEENEF